MQNKPVFEQAVLPEMQEQDSEKPAEDRQTSEENDKEKVTKLRSLFEVL